MVSVPEEAALGQAEKGTALFRGCGARWGTVCPSTPELKKSIGERERERENKVSSGILLSREAKGGKESLV